MQKRFHKPVAPPKHDSAKEKWSFMAPLVWNETIWEVWAKPPKKRVKKQYPRLKVFARDGALAKSSYSLLWHPKEARLIRSRDFHTMEKYQPGFLERIEGRLAKANIPGTEVASNGE